MSRTRQALFALVLGTAVAFTSVALWPSAVAACSCAWFDVPTARDQATHVFEGVLVNATPGPDGGASRAVFRVDNVWKGQVSRTFTVQARVGVVMCPPHLEVGQRYIVYTSGTNAAPRIQACARYAAGDGLAAERTALGAPTQTYPATAP